MYEITISYIWMTWNQVSVGILKKKKKNWENWKEKENCAATMKMCEFK